MIKKNLPLIIVIFMCFLQSAQCIVNSGNFNKVLPKNDIIAYSSEPTGFENYIIISDKQIKSVSSSNEEIVTAKIITTIMNERNTIIVKAFSVGTAVLTVTDSDGAVKINVNVKKNKTILKTNKSGFTFFPLDVPPNNEDMFDLPPSITGGN